MPAALRRAYRGPGGGGCSGARKGEAMLSTQRLDPRQQRTVEWYARSKGITCGTCGSADLACDDTARLHIGGNVSVKLRCTNQAGHVSDAGTVQRFRLSVEEAWAIGVKM
jgi:hypothetical protein